MQMHRKLANRDVFICHASEDKVSVVEPLVAAFSAEGVSFWYDKAELKWGDSLSQKVNDGLASSSYVIVVLSRVSISKSWPLKELYSSLNREIQQGKTLVLPLMVGSPDEIEQIRSKLPLQSDKLYLVWDGTPKLIVEEIKKLLGR